MSNNNNNNGQRKGFSVIAVIFIALVVVSGFFVYNSDKIAIMIGLNEQKFASVVQTVAAPTILFLGYILFEKFIDVVREDNQEYKKT